MPEYTSRKSAPRRVVGRMEPTPEAVVGPLPIRTWLIENLMQLALLGALGALVIAVGVAAFYRPPTPSPGQPRSSRLDIVGVFRPPSPTPTARPTPTSTPLPPPPQVAILAGHWSGENPPEGVVPDTGAICSDGLREVDINKGVADKVVAILRRQGMRVDLLQEFDSRLKADSPDYAPMVFLAIHSDSCVSGPDFPQATGYKIAHAEPSDVPLEDDRLVACLRQDYEAQVARYNLTFNENSITRDMTEYHAFRQIVNTSPAAIVELGFMSNDRRLLVGHQAELAKGLADGLVAFLRGDRCGTAAEPTPAH